MYAVHEPVQGRIEGVGAVMYIHVWTRVFPSSVSCMLYGVLNFHLQFLLPSIFIVLCLVVLGNFLHSSVGIDVMVPEWPAPSVTISRSLYRSPCPYASMLWCLQSGRHHR